MFNQALIFISAGAIFDTFGDLFMKNWVLTQSKTCFVCGMGFYIIGLSFLAYSFTFKNIVVASVLFLVFNILLLSLINWLYYNEALSLKDIIAMFLGLIAVIMFELK
jgi:multidrug transporter EmrE-like cation transporter